MNISVIVPVRNEQDSIRALIDSLLAQTLAPDEIVITDGGSSDATAAIISEYIERGAPIRLIREPAALPGRGRNLAAAQAAGQWLAFIDAGTRPEKNWLESLAAAVGKNVDVVYGTYEPVTDSRFKVCAVMAYVAPPFDLEGQQIRPCSIVSALMKRSVWEAAGGFPEHLRSAEDLLFMRKIERGGFRIVRAPEALVHWQVEPSALATFKRFVRYARSNMRAGLWSEWQAPLFKRYGMLLFSLLPAFFIGSRWLLVTLLLWLMLLVARGLVSLRRNRARYPASASENFRRGLVLAPLLALLDLATILGTLQWLFTDALKSEAARERVADGA
jgi:glycosyltransferase involved in cell wall biosynthesis